jgi:hypothetical protein
MVLVFRPYQYTSGFETYEKFSDHFQKARTRPPYIRSQLEFARWADRFCGGPRSIGVDECIRPYDGATLRFDNAKNLCGVLHPNRFIGSCFPSKRRYYDAQCRRQN